MSGFTAYVDESGCDGFAFDLGSTEFLILGAVIARNASLVQFDKAIADARISCRKPADYRFKSFKKLYNTSSQRWGIAAYLSKVKCQVVAVAVHKPSLTEQGWSENKDDLYFQAAKFLLERISWSCRDTHSVRAAQPDPLVEIVFSKKAGLRYDSLAKLHADLKR